MRPVARLGLIQFDCGRIKLPVDFQRRSINILSVQVGMFELIVRRDVICEVRVFDNPVECGIAFAVFSPVFQGIIQAA